MSDYNEHLISMAGGDGDELGDIQARLTADRDDSDGDWSDQCIRDREHLLALVREQAAKLEAVRNLHEPVMEDGEPVGCSMCDWEHPSYDFNKPWPCPTLAALEPTK